MRMVSDARKAAEAQRAEVAALKTQLAKASAAAKAATDQAGGNL